MISVCIYELENSKGLVTALKENFHVKLLGTIRHCFGMKVTCKKETIH
jgi:hypothetical protein